MNKKIKGFLMIAVSISLLIITMGCDINEKVGMDREPRFLNSSTSRAVVASETTQDGDVSFLSAYVPAITGWSPKGASIPNTIVTKIMGKDMSIQHQKQNNGSIRFTGNNDNDVKLDVALKNDLDFDYKQSVAGILNYKESGSVKYYTIAMFNGEIKPDTNYTGKGRVYYFAEGLKQGGTVVPTHIAFFETELRTSNSSIAMLYYDSKAVTELPAGFPTGTAFDADTKLTDLEKFEADIINRTKDQPVDRSSGKRKLLYAAKGKPVIRLDAANAAQAAEIDRIWNSLKD